MAFHKATPSGGKTEVSSKVGTMMTLLCPQVHLPKWKGPGTGSPSLLPQLHPYPEHLHRLQPANHHHLGIKLHKGRTRHTAESIQYIRKSPERKNRFLERVLNLINWEDSLGGGKK